MNKKGASFGTIVAMMGSALIAVGFAWLIAQNWHTIPSALKILILFAATAGSYTAGTMLRIRNYSGIGKALIILGSLLFTLSIFLIAQIFSTSTSLQGYAWLLVLCWIGVLAASYIFDSTVSLVIALTEFLIWILIQFTALFVDSYGRGFQPGLLAILFLIIGVLFFGMSLWHRLKDLDFSRLYQGWTAFYFLAFSYVMSFQIILPLLWGRTNESPASAIIFLCVMGVIALAAVLSGLLYDWGKVSRVEIGGFFAMVLLLLIVIISASIVSGDAAGTCYEKQCHLISDQDTCVDAAYKQCVWNNNRCEAVSCFDLRDESSCVLQKCVWFENENMPSGGSCGAEPLTEQKCFSISKRDACLSDNQCDWSDQRSYWGRGANISGSMWAMWIFTNIVFLAVILAVLGYGTFTGNKFMINLGIIFFALDILTRYIGFMMRLWGYTSLSVIFITGGVVLLAGGWFIEKWRRKLVSQTNTKD